MAIIGSEISSTRFTFIKSSKTFATEASDIKECHFLGRLYDDACDSGFVLRSERTGKTQAYVLSHPIVRAGELHGWVFEAAFPYAPGAEGTKVTIFND